VTLSVVVPTHGRGSLLVDCVESLLAAGVTDVVVADAASPDDTGSRITALAAPGIVYVRLPGRDANAARNAGMAAARGDLVALIDDDVLVPRGWAAAVVEGAARHPQADCFGGPVRPRYEARAPRTCPAHGLAGATLDEGGVEREVGEAWGCNMTLRRSAFERIGPFREGLRVQQEWEWQQRLLAAGGTIVHLPAAWLSHRRLASDLRLASMLGSAFRRGATKAALGAPVARRKVARRAASRLSHGVRARCTRGVFDGLRDLGLLWGSLRRS
jgi:glycosyltransferase involved in cell wall biosynthesis